MNIITHLNLWHMGDTKQIVLPYILKGHFHWKCRVAYACDLSLLLVGVLLWCNDLGIGHHHCSALGHCYGAGSVLGLGTSRNHECSQKKTEKKPAKFASCSRR